MKEGEVYRVIEPIYYVDFDEVLSRGVSPEAFLGYLSGAITTVDINNIVHNIYNVIELEHTFMLHKDDIIEITYIECEGDDTDYVEFLRNDNQSIEAVTRLREDCLERIR